MLHVLDNGLRVILQENHTAPVVALQMWVNVGSADDPERLSGMAHVLEHMIFKGTERRSGGQIAKEIEGAGGQINAWTAFDQTVYHVVLPSRFLPRGMDILSDVMQNARFETEELERERQVIFEEIKQGDDSPSKVLSRELFAAAYRRHAYGRSVIGHVSTVASITKEDIESFFGSWYAPGNMTLVITGDVAPTETMGRIRRLFNVPARPSPLRRRVSEPSQQEMRVTVKDRDLQEVYLSLAFHIPGFIDPETPALDLAAIVLGQGDASRLIRRIKHDQQLVSEIYAYSYTPRDPGLLIINAATQPEKLKRATQAIAAEVFALGTAEVTTEELRRAKTIIESDAVYQKETVQGQARKLGFFYSVAGSVDFEQEYYRRTSEMTAARIREVASRTFSPANLSVAVLSPSVRERETETAQVLRQAIRTAREEVKVGETVKTRTAQRVVKVTLGNGARLLVLRDPSVPLVAMRAVWNGGLRNEQEGNNGINSLLASLITRGTSTRTADQINEAIESMAGSIGGFSGLNSFGIRSELLSRHWEQGLEILTDCLLHPSFNEEEVERERRQLLDDIRAQQDNLNAVSLQLFSRSLYRKHPYRMDPLGTEESVAALSRGQIIEYYRRFFHPSNMVIAVVGDVEEEVVTEKFKQLFGASRRREVISISPPREPARTRPAEAIQFLNKQQAHIVVGFPGTSLRSKDRYPLEVLASVLSGQGGRLYLDLRDRQGLAYQVGAYSLDGIEPGYFAIYIATSPEKVAAALKGIDGQVKRLRERSVSRVELKRIQRYLVGSFEISLQRKATLASLLAFNECYGLGYQTYLRYVEEIMAVTVEDLKRVARKYLDDSRRVVVMVRPEELSPGAAQRLGETRAAGVAGEAPPPSRGQRARPPRKKR